MTPRLAILAALLLAACGSKAHPDRPGHGVLVLAIDALRADHLGVYGYDRPTMPRLDKLAEEGTVFLDAWSAAPELVASHASLLTGCDPTIARRPPLPDGTRLTEVASWWIPDSIPRVAREFLIGGYRTAAFVDHPLLSPVYGFDRGFEHFTGYRVDTRGYVLGFEAVGDKFLRWLQEIDAGQDWFAYVHVNDLERLWRVLEPDPDWDTFFEPRPELAHVPPVGEAEHVFFAVPRPRWERGGIRSLGEYEARYDGALRRLNSLITRLFLTMQHQGKWDETTVVVVGTYGVGFGESGLLLDTGTLSDADLHVPWIVRPGRSLAARQGQRAEGLASAIDLAPTLLDLCGIEVPKGMDGVSQAGVLRAGGAEAETPPRSVAFASGGLQLGFAAIDEQWIYEWSAPGSARPGALVESWYGDRVPDRVEYREMLIDRARGASGGRALGNLGPSDDDPAASVRLHTAGLEWFQRIEHLRDQLHEVPWAGGELGPEQIDSLRRRGLVQGEGSGS